MTNLWRKYDAQAWESWKSMIPYLDLREGIETSVSYYGLRLWGYDGSPIARVESIPEFYVDGSVSQIQKKIEVAVQGHMSLYKCSGPLSLKALLTELGFTRSPWLHGTKS